MKFAILSLVTAGALAVSAGTASAGPPGHYHGGRGGYSYGHPRGGHLDYHNGHYHYHNGYYRSGPLVPVYPSYPSYGYGYNSTFAQPGFSIGIGSGAVTPYYNYGGLYSSPYNGGGGFYRRW